MGFSDSDCTDTPRLKFWRETLVFVAKIVELGGDRTRGGMGCSRLIRSSNTQEVILK